MDLHVDNLDKCNPCVISYHETYKSYRNVATEMPVENGCAGLFMIMSPVSERGVQSCFCFSDFVTWLNFSSCFSILKARFWFCESNVKFYSWFNIELQILWLQGLSVDHQKVENSPDVYGTKWDLNRTCNLGQGSPK